jgi:photosystem II stability/assembly factor-like uncharacterized protein
LSLAAISGCKRVAAIEPPIPQGMAVEGRFRGIEQAALFEPAGKSNVRSSFHLADDVGLIGSEETGDVFKTSDGGHTWFKVWDGGDEWGMADVRNSIRGQDGHIYITPTEPATVARSTDEGDTWQVIARPKSSRTVGLVQLDDGTMLVGLRRSENGLTSIVRKEDYLENFAWLPLASEGPRQNVASFG